MCSKQTKTDNGWITTEAFLEWLTGTFVPGVADLPKPVLINSRNLRGTNKSINEQYSKETKTKTRAYIC